MWPRQFEMIGMEFILFTLCVWLRRRISLCLGFLRLLAKIVSRSHLQIDRRFVRFHLFILVFSHCFAWNLSFILLLFLIKIAEVLCLYEVWITKIILNNLLFFKEKFLMVVQFLIFQFEILIFLIDYWLVSPGCQ